MRPTSRPGSDRPAPADLPITIHIGTLVLAAWIGFWFGWAFLMNTLGVLLGAVLGIVAAFTVRHLIRGRTARFSMITFVALSAVTFLTLVLPVGEMP